MNPYEDEDDEEIFNVYENAQWYWDEKNNTLEFKSAFTQEVDEDVPMSTGLLGGLEFRQDIDLNEQQRFRKRFQRKYGSTDVVTLQDVKDVVLFTAPTKILIPTIIKLLHLPATERLIRALIMYIQYFLQTSDIMRARTAELQAKIRTLNSEETEAVYHDNLEDLRLLVGKEYAAYLTGSGEFAKYHHMGLHKKSPSLLKKERMMFESFVRINIQIIWIALGRKSFGQIELEVHRLFKSSIFNLAQHNVDQSAEHPPNLTAREFSILTGDCVINKKKVNTMSPLMNEVHCERDIEYRMYGLGVVDYPRMNARLRHLEAALSLPESNFQDIGITMGILGTLRNRFDIMLNEIVVSQTNASTASASSVWKLGKKASSLSSKSSAGTKPKKSTSSASGSLYAPISLPEKDEIMLLDEFPHRSIRRRSTDKIQQDKWLYKITRKQKRESKIKI